MADLERVGTQVVAEGMGAYIAQMGQGTRALGAFDQQNDVAGQSVAAFGQQVQRVKLDTLTQQIGLQQDRLGKLNGQYQTTVEKYGIFSQQAEKQRGAIDRLNISLQSNQQRATLLSQAIAKQAEATQQAVPATDKLRGNSDKLADSTQKQGQAAQASTGPTQRLGATFEGVGRFADVSAGRIDAWREVSTGAFRYVGELAVRAGMEIAQGLGRGLAYVIDTGATFEVTMSGVAAVLQPTGDQLANLSDKALQLGADTSFSAQQAGEAIEMLAKNGLDYDAIINGAADATIALAAATGAKLPEAADIATDVMANFRDVANDMGAAIDGITGVTVASKFGIDDYRLALAQAGGVAGALGIEFDDFNTTIAVTSSRFASGSDAGTSFKTFIQRLTPDTKPATAAMSELGIITAEAGNRFYDAQGNLKDMRDIAQILQEATAGLSEEQKNQALSTIFGTDAMRTAIGVAEAGAEGFDKVATSIEKVSAADQAATRLDNFKGSVEQFKGSLETLSIVISQDILPQFRPFVDLGTQGLNVLIALARGTDDASLQFSNLVTAIDGVIPGFSAFYNEASIVVSSLVDFATQAYNYGVGLAEQYGAGIMAGISWVIDAVYEIGNSIASLLQLNSPPKIVPDLDSYGTGAAQLYLDSWGAADYSVFSTIGNTISQELRSIYGLAGDALPKEGLIPQILGTRSAVADAIEQLRSTGEIGAEAYQRIRDAAGPAGENIAHILELTVESTQAAEDYADAQEKVNEITAEYNAQLDELAGKREAVNETFENSATQAALDANKQAQKQLDREQDRAKLLETIADGSKSEAERREAQLKIEQIALEERRDTEKVARDEAIKGIDAEVDAVQVAKDAAITAAQEELKAAEARKQEADAAMKAAQERIAFDRETRDLQKEQLDLLKQMAQEAEKAAKAAAKSAKAEGKKAGAGKKAGGGGAKAKPGGAGRVRPGKPDADDEQEVPKEKSAWEKAQDEARKRTDQAKKFLETPVENAAIDPSLAAAESAAQAMDNVGKSALSLQSVMPLLVGIGTAVASVVVPAMYSAAVAFGVAAAPLVAIGLAGAALYVAWSSNFLGIRDVVADVWNGISTIFGSFTSTFSTAREDGQSFWDSFKLAASTAYDTFMGALPGILESVNGLFRDIVDTALTRLPEWGAALVGFGVAAVTWVSDKLPALIDVLGQYYNSMVNWVLDSIPGWASNLATFGGKAISWVLDALPGLGTNLGTFAGKLLGWVVQTTGEAVPKLAEMGVKFVSWVVTDVLPELPGALYKIGMGIYGFIEELEKEVRPKIRAISDRFLNWVQEDVIPYIGGKLDAFKQSIFEWVIGNTVAIGSYFLDVGASIVSGIITGIQNAASQLFDSLRNLANDALEAAKQAISSNSPSKLFADQVGYNIGSGIALGINQSIPLIERSLVASVAVPDRMVSPPMIGRASGGTTIINNSNSVPMNFANQPMTGPQLQRVITATLNNIARSSTNRGRMRG